MTTIQTEYSPMTTPLGQQPKTSALAVWSLVLGILSLTCIPLLTTLPAVICGHMALSRIRRSLGTLTGKGLAIGGLVTGYLGIASSLVVLPMLLAIAVPNFVKARSGVQTAQCRMNLQTIDGAKQTWAVENKKSVTDTPSRQDLSAYLKDGALPTCAADGTYTINAVGTPPSCSVHGTK